MNTTFSIVLPTYNAPAELDLCLRSLHANSSQEHEILAMVDPLPQATHKPEILQTLSRYPKVRVFRNKRQQGPYTSWNQGAAAAKNQILCFITDDQYFAKDWDKDLLKAINQHPGKVLTSQFVESGAKEPYHTNLCRNFGFSADTFDEKGFQDYVKQHQEDRLAIDGFYSPTVIHRDVFNRLKGWPDRKPFPFPNDRLFRQKLHAAGLEYERVLTSFTYHFQGSTHRDDQTDNRMYFEYMESWHKPEPTHLFHRLKKRVKAKLKWELKRFGLLPKKQRVSGWCRKKKADMALAYKYCVGRGIEIGPGSNRFPNVQTVVVDMVSDFHDRQYPLPDVEGDAYDMSSFADQSKDFLINSHVMEHLLDPIRALKLWSRVVREGGYFFFVIPDKRLMQQSTDNLAPITTLDDLIHRHRLGMRETVDNDPRTSCKGNPRTANFDPQGTPGLRHFNYWRPQDVIDLLKYVRLEPVEVLGAADKDRKIDRHRFGSYDDFTVVAQVTPAARKASLS